VAVKRKKTSKKTVAKKTVSKKAVAKKAAAKKTAAKKTVAKRAVAKKSVAKRAVAKKTVAKKAVAKKTVAKKINTRSSRNGRLTAKDIKHFKNVLLQKRREILQNVFEIEGEALKKSRLDASGDLSSMPIHMADLGTDNFQQEFSLELMDGERRLLVEIDEALNRMENRTYGVCEGTGKPISKARLEAKPWARYCVEYAKMLEQGLVREAG